MIKFNLIITALLLIAFVAYRGVFSVNSDLARVITTTLAIGLVLSGGTWVLGDVFHVSWIKRLTQRL